MQQTVCDRCKILVNEQNMTAISATDYKQLKPDSLFSNRLNRNIDLCADCRDKFYFWLSGDYDENTTETK